jgi:methanogenic corrinoid protein MtbC1
MNAGTRDERIRLAESIDRLASEIAEAVTAEFLGRHPEWVERYGERARRFGIEDAAFHMQFLSGSIVSGEPSRFGDYARWTAGMLASRGIASPFLVENLEQIREALRQRLSTANMAVVEPHMDAGVSAAATTDSGAAAPADAEGSLGLTLSVYTQAILKGDRNAAITVLLEAIKNGADPLDIHVEVLQQALYRVGRLWETNEITVADEHMATAITQFAVTTLYPHLPRATVQRGTIVLTGIKGEMHQVGAMMLCDVLEADGWDTRFLGTNMPIDGIVKAVQEYQPAVLGISTMMLFNLPRVTETIQACRAAASHDLRVIVGGGAYRDSPMLYREIGADAYASDLKAAREVLRGEAGVA